MTDVAVFESWAVGAGAAEMRNLAGMTFCGAVRFGAAVQQAKMGTGDERQYVRQ
jgi:hypothetical protein